MFSNRGVAIRFVSIKVAKHTHKSALWRKLTYTINDLGKVSVAYYRGTVKSKSQRRTMYAR